jgi:hypothetical protein
MRCCAVERLTFVPHRGDSFIRTIRTTLEALITYGSRTRRILPRPTQVSVRRAISSSQSTTMLLDSRLFLLTLHSRQLDRCRGVRVDLVGIIGCCPAELRRWWFRRESAATAFRPQSS